MVSKSKYNDEKGYNKELSEFRKGKYCSEQKRKELIKETIHYWKDLTQIFDGFGHQVVPPNYLLEKNVPQEIVNHHTDRNYGYDTPLLEVYDDEIDKWRFMEDNEYLEGITKYEFVSSICQNLGLPTSTSLGRGSSCRQNSDTIREYLKIQSISDEWKEKN